MNYSEQCRDPVNILEYMYKNALWKGAETFTTYAKWLEYNKDLLKCVSVLRYGVSTSNEYVGEFEEAIEGISGRMRERIIRDCGLTLQIGKGTRDNNNNSNNNSKDKDKKRPFNSITNPTYPPPFKLHKLEGEFGVKHNRDNRDRLWGNINMNMNMNINTSESSESPILSLTGEEFLTRISELEIESIKTLEYLILYYTHYHKQHHLTMHKGPQDTELPASWVGAYLEDESLTSTSPPEDSILLKQGIENLGAALVSRTPTWERMGSVRDSVYVAKNRKSSRGEVARDATPPKDPNSRVQFKKGLLHTPKGGRGTVREGDACPFLSLREAREKRDSGERRDSGAQRSSILKGGEGKGVGVGVGAHGNSNSNRTQGHIPQGHIPQRTQPQRTQPPQPPQPPRGEVAFGRKASPSTNNRKSISPIRGNTKRKSISPAGQYNRSNNNNNSKSDMKGNKKLNFQEKEKNTEIESDNNIDWKPKDEEVKEFPGYGDNMSIEEIHYTYWVNYFGTPPLPEARYMGEESVGSDSDMELLPPNYNMNNMNTYTDIEDTGHIEHIDRTPLINNLDPVEDGSEETPEFGNIGDVELSEHLQCISIIEKEEETRGIIGFEDYKGGRAQNILGEHFSPGVTCPGVACPGVAYPGVAYPDPPTYPSLDSPSNIPHIPQNPQNPQNPRKEKLKGEFRLSEKENYTPTASLLAKQPPNPFLIPENNIYGETDDILDISPIFPPVLHPTTSSLSTMQMMEGEMGAVRKGGSKSVGLERSSLDDDLLQLSPALNKNNNTLNNNTLNNNILNIQGGNRGNKQENKQGNAPFFNYLQPTDINININRSKDKRGELASVHVGYESEGTISPFGEQLKGYESGSESEGTIDCRNYNNTHLLSNNQFKGIKYNIYI